VIPLVRLRLGLNDGQLGGLLLCLGLGSVLTMPLAGGLSARLGCRRTILGAALVGCIALPLAVSAPNQVQLAACLLAFGAGVGTLDAVMNIQAVMVEKARGRAMMSGFHGLFSVGSIAGAGAVTGMLSLGLAPLACVLVVVGLSAALLAGLAGGLLAEGGDATAPATALPRGSVLLIGALCFCMFLAEGSVLDWSGVLLNTVRGVGKSHAGIGFVVFAITMTAGRLTGDSLVARFGHRRMLLWGGLCAATGFVLAATVPSSPVSVVGFGLVGAGAANVVPTLFSAAGRQSSTPSNLAVAAVTTMGYAGLLTGPGLIGLVARVSSLSVGMVVVAGLAVCVSLGSRRATT